MVSSSSGSDSAFVGERAEISSSSRCCLLLNRGGITSKSLVAGDVVMLVVVVVVDNEGTKTRLTITFGADRHSNPLMNI